MPRGRRPLEPDTRRFHGLDEGLHEAFFAMTDRASVWAYVQHVRIDEEAYAFTD